MAWPHKLDVENSGVESVKGSPNIRMQRRFFHVCRNMEQQPWLAADDRVRMDAMLIKRDFN